MTAIPYLRLNPPSRDAVADLMTRAGWSRRQLAEAVHVGESTVDQWLALPGARRVSAMPPGLFELACAKAWGGVPPAVWHYAQAKQSTQPEK